MRVIINLTDNGYINVEATEITECEGFFYCYDGNQLVGAAKKEFVKEIHLSEKG